MNETLARLLSRSVFQATMQARNRRALRVLAFHRVDERSRFRRLMTTLRDRYTPVGLDAVLGHLRGRSALPDRPVLVTFDDAHPSVAREALPVLEEMEIPAVVFVIAGLVGTEELPWWEEVEAIAPDGASDLVDRFKRMPDRDRRARIRDLRRQSSPPPAAWVRQLAADDLRELERKGIEIGNHTLTHPILPRCEDDVVEREIVEAHAVLTEVLGHPPRAFAYPNGDPSRRARELLDSLGYEVAFLFDHRLTRLGGSDPLELSRLRSGANASTAALELSLSGLHPTIYHLRRRLGLA